MMQDLLNIEYFFLIENSIKLKLKQLRKLGHDFGGVARKSLMSGIFLEVIL